MPSVSHLFLAKDINLAICLSVSLDIFAKEQELVASQDAYIHITNFAV